MRRSGGGNGNANAGVRSRLLLTGHLCHHTHHARRVVSQRALHLAVMSKRDKFLESCRKQKLDTVRWSLGPGGQSPAIRDDEGQGLTLVHFSAQLERFVHLYGIGVARRACVARVKKAVGGVQGVQGVCLCPTRLKLS
jgi:hypothetical protein